MSGLARPDHWEEKLLGDVAEITGGLTRNASKRKDATETVPLVSVAAVHMRRIVAESVGEVGLLPTDGDKATLNKGDLLIVEGNGSLDHIGRVAIWNDEVPGARHQNHIIRVRPKDVEPKFVLEWLASPSGREAIVREATSVSGLYNLSLSKVARLPVLVPPLPEQRSIVAKIEALQARSRAAREALDAVGPLLEKFRQSVLAAAFRGDLTADWRAKNPDVEPANVLLDRIRKERRRRWEEDQLSKMKAKGKAPKDDRWKAKYVEPKPVDTEGLPELPDGWCWARWSEVGFNQNGRAFPSREYSETGVRLLRPGNLHASGALKWTKKNTRCMPRAWAEKHPEFIVEGRELLINLTAQSLKDEFLGRVCLSSPGERCLLNQRIGRLTPVLLTPEFCLWLFKSRLFRAYVESGLNSGSLIQHMFTSQVDEFIFPLPPSDEQAQIVERLQTSATQQHAAAVAHSNAASGFGALNQSVLSRAFRGDLVSWTPGENGL